MVLGAHGLGRIDCSAVGSVCERVARLVESDLLVAKDTRPIAGGPILVAIDGSDQSFGALEVALEISHRFDTRVKAVAAYDPFFHGAAFQSIAQVLTVEASSLFRFTEQERLHDEIIDSGLMNVYRSHLEVAQRRAEREGLQLEIEVLEGKPFDAIAAHARELRPSLLLLGRTGIHHDDGVKLGSTAENLLRLAECNLLITSRCGQEVQENSQADGRSRPAPAWSKDAERRLERVPFFIRKMVRKRIEEFAAERGYTEITLEAYEEARRRFGM